MAVNHLKHKHTPSAEQDRRDRELDTWLHKAMGMHSKADPEPVLRDL